MTATNHALTGAIIGLVIQNPVIALPAALASHLICDAIPHFGSNKDWIAKNSFALYLLIEAFICGLLVLLLFVTQPANWLLAAMCAFVAASPDFLSIRAYVAARQGKPFTPNLLERFLKKIQWFERPIGAAVEAAWFVAGVTILSVFL
jgi:hypothetical protein